MVIEILDAQPPFTTATVEFGGIRRRVSLACVPEAQAGDYVLVHAGVAISRIDAAEATKVFEALDQLDLREELSEPLENDTPNAGATRHISHEVR
jgi:hydrogenase expression/formation protein HypC